MPKRYLITEIIVWTIMLGLVFTGVIFGYSKLFVEPNVYNIQFKDIDGITKGSPVRFMGINIGYVKKLKTAGKHVDVQILVTKKDMKIPNGTVARVEFYGLGGSKSVELMPPDGTSGAGILTGDNIRLHDIILEASGLVDVIEEIEKFAKGIDENAMKSMLDSVASFKMKHFGKLNKDMDNAKKAMDKSVLLFQKREHNLNKKIDNFSDSIKKH